MSRSRPSPKVVRHYHYYRERPWRKVLRYVLSAAIIYMAWRIATHLPGVGSTHF